MTEVLSESQLHVYERLLPKYVADEYAEEAGRKLIASHQILMEANAFLSYENLLLKSKLKEACQLINVRTTEGAKAYERLTRGMISHA